MTTLSRSTESTRGVKPVSLPPLHAWLEIPPAPKHVSRASRVPIGAGSTQSLIGGVASSRPIDALIDSPALRSFEVPPQ